MIFDAARVFERNEKMRRTRVALPRTTAAQLAVDASGLVAFGSKHMQSSDFGNPRIAALLVFLRERFSPKRQEGARKMAGLKNELFTLRELRARVFG